MVNLTITFRLTLLSTGPLGLVSLELLADKIPKTAENICAVSTGEGAFIYKGFCFHRIMLGFMCQGGDFTHRKWHRQHVHLWGEIRWWEFHPETYEPWHLVHGKCWTQYKWFPVFHLHCQDWVVGWQACALLAKWEMRGCCGSHWSFGSRMARPARPLLTVDNKNQFDLFFSLTTRPCLL